MMNPEVVEAPAVTEKTQREIPRGMVAASLGALTLLTGCTTTEALSQYGGLFLLGLGLTYLLGYGGYKWAETKTGSVIAGVLSAAAVVSGGNTTEVGTAAFVGGMITGTFFSVRKIIQTENMRKNS